MRVIIMVGSFDEAVSVCACIIPATANFHTILDEVFKVFFEKRSIIP